MDNQEGVYANKKISFRARHQIEPRLTITVRERPICFLRRKEKIRHSSAHHSTPQHIYDTTGLDPTSPPSPSLIINQKPFRIFFRSLVRTSGPFMPARHLSCLPLIFFLSLFESACHDSKTTSSRSLVAESKIPSWFIARSKESNNMSKPSFSPRLNNSVIVPFSHLVFCVYVTFGNRRRRNHLAILSCTLVYLIIPRTMNLSTLLGVCRSI